jgi:NTE family protein
MTEEKKQLRHIIISGGHIWGLHALGVINKCIEEKVIDLHQIKSIHGTSIGSLIGAILALKPDMKDIADYFINRPWHNLIKKYELSPLGLYNSNGLLTCEFINDILSPILKSHDISIDITLEEFYNETGVELYVYATELNEYVTECLSYKTHPEWRLLDAIYASCALPILFRPYFRENKCYIDGAILMNYPLEKCIDLYDNDEIFGIPIGKMEEEEITLINENTTFADYISTIFMKILLKTLLFPNNDYKIPYEVKLYSNLTSIDYIINFLTSDEERKSVYNYAYDHMSKLFEEDELWKNKLLEHKPIHSEPN